MRILYLSIPDLAIAWARSREPALAGRPLALLAAGRVKACSVEAAQAGIGPGMPEHTLVARCPEICVREMAEEKLCAAWRQLVTALGAYSPVVEAPEEGQTCLTIAGLERRYSDELRLGLAVARQAHECLALPAGIGIADGKFIARAASLQAYPGSVLIVPAGAERYFLQDLSVNLLPLTEDGRRQLSLLGVQTLAQYTALPSDGVHTRFGPEGLAGWHWAQGVDRRPLVPGRSERCLEATVEFDDPVREQPILQQALARLLDDLCTTLQREALACQDLQLTVEMEKGPQQEGYYVLREPTADPKRLQTIALAFLAHLPCALQGLTVRLSRIGRSRAGQQMDLFIERRLAADLDAALIALTTRYGEGCFQQALAANPDSPLPERRFALEPFRIAS